EQDLGPAGLGEKLSRGVPDVPLDDVVPKHDADLVTLGEVLAELEGVSDAALPRLVGVFEVLEAPVLAVLEQLEDVPGVLAAGDDEHVPYPGVEQALDGVVD